MCSDPTAEAIPKDARRVLLFGGSFDPPTLAHIQLPPIVADAIDADVIAYIPTLNPPHKPGRKLASARDRVAMLRRAVADEPRAVVLTLEIDRESGRPSYTVDTLRELRDRTTAELRLLVGADQVKLFDTWREPEAIQTLAEPVVMVRPPETVESLLASLPQRQRDVWRRRLVVVPALDISATEARDLLAERRNVDHLIAPAVADYIKERGLYSADA